MRMKLAIIGTLVLFALGLVACEPEQVIVEVTRLIEVPVEVTRVVTETVIEEGQMVEVTRIVTEVEEVVVTATGASAEAVEVTRLVEVTREVTRVVAAPPSDQGEITAEGTPVATAAASELVSFSSPDDPEVLNEALGWQAGGSEANSYDLTLNPGALTLVGGPNTDQWRSVDSAPAIIYPVSGDFLAEVKVVFAPDENYQTAGIGIRSVGEPTWLRIARIYDSGNKLAVSASDGGNSSPLSVAEYVDDTVWLRVQRRGSIFNFSYSTNGSNWVELEKDLVFELPGDAELFLNAYSTANTGVVAQFSEFSVEPQ